MKTAIAPLVAHATAAANTLRCLMTLEVTAATKINAASAPTILAMYSSLDNATQQSPVHPSPDQGESRHNVTRTKTTAAMSTAPAIFEIEGAFIGGLTVELSGARADV